MKVTRGEAFAAKHVQAESKREQRFANRCFLASQMHHVQRHIISLEKNQVTDYLHGSHSLSARRARGQSQEARRVFSKRLGLEGPQDF